MEKGMNLYKGEGEVRRINVVYFLSRGGRTDHPHLFRVNHLHRAGVRLRDVKRWLSEIRGKDMPENFAWSYKRKYKAGYVWQDLMDDDLITPISDNEYVLKGCDVRGTPPPCAEAPKANSSDVKAPNGKEDEKSACDQKQAVEEALHATAPDSGESSPKPPPTDHDSPTGEGEPARRTAPFRIVLPQNLKDQQQRQEEEEAKAVTSWAPPRDKKHPVGKARRMRVAQVLHSILTCGAADANDAALRPAKREVARDGDERTPVCPGVDGCDIMLSRKVKVRRGGKERVKRDDANKPASLPHCSQCGKEFKPQELHSHMQSCRGLRERMRRSATTRVSARNSTARSKADHSPDRPASIFLLTES